MRWSEGHRFCHGGKTTPYPTTEKTYFKPSPNYKLHLTGGWAAPFLRWEMTTQKVNPWFSLSSFRPLCECVRNGPKRRKAISLCEMTFCVVGMRGFEPPASRPPDVHSNRAELHPALIVFRKLKFPFRTSFLFRERKYKQPRHAVQ